MSFTNEQRCEINAKGQAAPTEEVDSGNLSAWNDLAMMAEIADKASRVGKRVKQGSGNFGPALLYFKAQVKKPISSASSGGFVPPNYAASLVTSVLPSGPGIFSAEAQKNIREGYAKIISSGIEKPVFDEMKDGVGKRKMTEESKDEPVKKKRMKTNEKVNPKIPITLDDGKTSWLRYSQNKYADGFYSLLVQLEKEDVIKIERGTTKTANDAIGRTPECEENCTHCATRLQSNLGSEEPLVFVEVNHEKDVSIAILLLKVFVDIYTEKLGNLEGKKEWMENMAKKSAGFMKYGRKLVKSYLNFEKEDESWHKNFKSSNDNNISPAHKSLITQLERANIFSSGWKVPCSKSRNDSKSINILYARSVWVSEAFLDEAMKRKL
jgi:hypothetical protein